MYQDYSAHGKTSHGSSFPAVFSSSDSCPRQKKGRPGRQPSKAKAFCCLAAAILCILFLPAAFPLADYQDTETLKKVQSVLAGQGYYTVPVDGIYGPATSLAIGQYQEAKGLTIDGLVTDELLDSLRLRPGSAPDLPPRRAEIHTLDFFDESLYDGTWVAISDPESGIGYEAYLPSWWDLKACYLDKGTYSLIYEPENPQQETAAVEEVLEEVSGEESTIEGETETTTVELSVAEVSAAEESAAEITTTEESAAEITSAEESAAEITTTEESAAEITTADESAAEITTADESAAKEAMAEESTGETTEKEYSLTESWDKSASEEAGKESASEEAGKESASEESVENSSEASSETVLEVITETVSEISSEALTEISSRTVTENSTEESTEPETPEEAGAFIDMAVFQVIQHPEGTTRAASGMSFLTMVYEKYEYPNTFVGECRINHFTGLSLTAEEKRGNPDYTYLFAGKDSYGEELVVSFSALSHRKMVMDIFGNILSSIHRIGEPRNVAPAVEPTATPTPLPTATPAPGALEASRTVCDANGIAEPEILFVSSLPDTPIPEEEAAEEIIDDASYTLPAPESIDSSIPFVQEATEGMPSQEEGMSSRNDITDGPSGPVRIPASNDKPVPAPSVTPTPNPTATPSPLPTEIPSETPTPVALPLPAWYSEGN